MLWVFQGMTQPPPRLSERNLIAAMERHGIGTDATVADHIKKQLDRGYATKDAQVPAFQPQSKVLLQGMHVNLFDDRYGFRKLYSSAQPLPALTPKMRRTAQMVTCGMQALFWPTPLGEALVGGYFKMGLSNLWQPNLRCVLRCRVHCTYYTLPIPSAVVLAHTM